MWIRSATHAGVKRRTAPDNQHKYISKMVTLQDRWERVDSWIGSAECSIQDMDDFDTETQDSSEAVFPLDEDDYYDAFCSEYMSFTNNNPTTCHAVQYMSEMLEARGFVYIPETRPIDEKTARAIIKGGCFYTSRGGLSLVAFIIGGQWQPENGIGAIGSHVDALTAKLKPCSIKPNVDGYQMLGVANYSGSLQKNWLDRDLGIGGGVIIKKNDKVSRKIVSSGSFPIARIPSLAEHFGAVADGPYNKETQMVPIIGYGEAKEASETEKSAPLYGKHPLPLLRYVATRAGCKLEEIVGVDLELYDIQSACRGGLDNEFMFAPRIDDRLCSFAAINALLSSASEIKNSTTLKQWNGLNMVLLADNEEIGSGSRTGAKGKFLSTTLKRILSARNLQLQHLSVTFANSLILSADVTHALNPNFKSAYLDNHYPVPNKGLTIKMDANGRVMTDSIGTAMMQKIAEKNNLQFQTFHVRNDMPSGSTIGPILAVETGARVVDVGLPQLSMHSIRAMCGYKEAGLGIKAFEAFFRDRTTVARAVCI
ncbi:hypothetical protein PGUG_00246 [Meyerozyma guilliermondii ATCC 6260]|uniref:Aspartyl aminopeptidase n=1 Tax=Meyerozyma guilliermondii (strain ATCC 6260 / CBS 566 / DSM 6381 / JCM 1539 / NBRC 10279 / NRRL Y-324) TaxID=294746 RepID=A5DAE1_PICGU|nr:uncharacterized protein PGUG_00246 [Meyerozyma guilliermondii ATCC 6260]EDK36148.2 hypothetical protein PGUG_00246 [Meyerozyma guilliermondii ATCC 6260]